MKKIILFFMIACATCLAVSPTTTSFNKGKVTLLMESRIDFPGYKASCRTVENMLITIHGPAQRRPGTKYISTVPLNNFSRGTDPGLTHTLAISNLAELQAMESVLDGNYYLTNDIDAGASSTDAVTYPNGFIPIGNAAGTSFTGTLDGQGYAITDLYMDTQVAGRGAGLFGSIDGGTVYNLDLVDCVVVVTGTGGLLAGNVANAAVIQGIVASGTMTTVGSQSGGLIGSGTAGTPLRTIKNCAVDVAMSKATAVSGVGIFSGNVNGVYSDCYATGSLTAPDARQCGGFIGTSGTTSTFTSCTTSGTLPIQDPANVLTNGGFIGSNNTPIGATFTDSCFLDTINARAFGGSDEQQRNTASHGAGNNQTGGTWTYTFDGTTTGTIAWNATEAQTQTAFDAAFGAGVIEVSGNTPMAGANFQFYFYRGDDYTREDVALATADASNLTGTASPYTFTITEDSAGAYPTLTTGSPPVSETSIISPTRDNERVRLIPFTVSTNDTYPIEWGDGYARFYRNGAVIGAPYEITTPYATEDLPNIHYDQTDDLMYLADGSNPPQILTRTDHDDWTIADVTFETGPFLPENETTTTITPTEISGGGIATGASVTLTASSAIFSVTASATHIGSIWQINQTGGTPSVTDTFSANGTSISTAEFQGGYSFTTSGNSGGTITLQRSTNNGVSWRNALVPLTNTDFDNPAEIEEDGAIFRAVMSGYASGTPTYSITVTDDVNKGIVEITAVASTTSATATVINTLVSEKATTQWREGYWSDYRGWPKTVTFHQQRLVYGGSTSYPQVVWFGKQDPDDYANFYEGTFDTAAFSMALEGQNPIRWLSSQDYLFIGTSGSVGKYGDQGKSVTPTTPNFQEQSSHGSDSLMAVKGGDTMLYVERGSRIVREFKYDFGRDQHLSPDMTLLSPEITDSGIYEYAFQLRPSPILWCILNNGNLATMTYQPGQSVIAWALQITDGDFESVCVIPGDDEDEIWVAVMRTINSVDTRFVEQFQPRDWGTDPNDAYFLDSALSYDGTATASFTGLDHLEGETVSIYADRLIENPEIVVSGAITIDNAASRVLAGMPYTSKLETFPLVIDPQDKAFNKKVKVVWADLYETGALQYGNTSSATLTTVRFNNDLTYDAAATAQDLYTSTVKPLRLVWGGYGTLKKQTVYIQSSDPMPLTVRSLTPEYDLIGN